MFIEEMLYEKQEDLWAAPRRMSQVWIWFQGKNLAQEEWTGTQRRHTSVLHMAVLIGWLFLPYEFL